ncbi:MAG: hypothetical protein EZS28_041373, partial [Streblomastix strix]
QSQIPSMGAMSGFGSAFSGLGGMFGQSNNNSNQGQGQAPGIGVPPGCNQQ